MRAWPRSLYWATEMAIGGLQFGGAVFTDDLSTMRALTLWSPHRGVAHPELLRRPHHFQLPFSLANDQVSGILSFGNLDIVMLTVAVARSPVTRISVTEVAMVPCSLLALRNISLLAGFLPRSLVQSNVSIPGPSALFWWAVTVLTSALIWSSSELEKTYLYANTPPTDNAAITAVTAAITIGVGHRRGRPSSGG
jgi:hypothetical protein